MSTKSILHGERVRLTAISTDDLPRLAQWRADSTFMHLYDSVPTHPQPLARIEKWLQDSYDSSRDFLFGIRTLDDDALIGMAELDGIMWVHRVCGLSIGIGEAPARSKGYGTDAMRLLLNYAFNELNLYRVQLTVFDYNTTARKLYEKLGFVHEGTFRSHRVLNGQRHDMHLFGLLRDEWLDNG